MARIEFHQIGYDAEGEPQYGIREAHTLETVIYTNKKEPLLRDICWLVGYTGRDVHVILTDAVQLIGLEWSGVSRVRYRAVNIKTLEIIPMPQKEGALVQLNLAMAVVAATVLEGRQKPLTVYIRPENVRAKWYGAANRREPATDKPPTPPHSEDT